MAAGAYQTDQTYRYGEDDVSPDGTLSGFLNKGMTSVTAAILAAKVQVDSFTWANAAPANGAILNCKITARAPAVGGVAMQTKAIPTFVLNDGVLTFPVAGLYAVWVGGTFGGTVTGRTFFESVSAYPGSGRVGTPTGEDGGSAFSLQYVPAGGTVTCRFYKTVSGTPNMSGMIVVAQLA